MLRKPSHPILTAIAVGIAVAGLLLVVLAPVAAAGRRTASSAEQVAQAPSEAPRRSEPPRREAKQARPARTQAGEPAVYVPPRRGAPRPRMPGGIRGATGLPTPLVLAPEHVAETLSEHPALFWHLDALPGREATILFTLVDEREIEPVAERPLASPARPGIQRIDLRRLGIALDPGVEYEWSVALVVDEKRRSLDRISTGSIRRVARPVALRDATTPAFAANGLWYDALVSISDAIDAAPSDPALRSQRDALLRQANLDAALD